MTEEKMINNQVVETVNAAMDSVSILKETVGELLTDLAEQFVRMLAEDRRKIMEGVEARIALLRTQEVPEDERGAMETARKFYITGVRKLAVALDVNPGTVLRWIETGALDQAIVVDEGKVKIFDIRKVIECLRPRWVPTAKRYRYIVPSHEEMRGEEQD